MEFEWDPAKAAMNRRKHGVSFEEAETVFAIAPRIAFDDFHSVAEDRFIALGPSNRSRVLYVSHIYRGGRIRIIMARAATKRERKHYGEEPA